MGPDKPAKSAVVPDHLAESANGAEQEIAKGIQLAKGAGQELRVKQAPAWKQLQIVQDGQGPGHADQHGQGPEEQC